MGEWIDRSWMGPGVRASLTAWFYDGNGATLSSMTVTIRHVDEYHGVSVEHEDGTFRVVEPKALTPIVAETHA